ncbi:MAG: hypothetical protein IPI67_13180 [Myxococcales bacterium]|nr:hypothetical protein [Myxococcales bacterium]
MSGKPLAAVWLTAALVLATVAEVRADAAGRAQPVRARDPSQYVRLGAGLGAYFGPRSSTYYTGTPWGSFVTSTTTVAGLSIPFELALGGPVSRGLVLGAGAYGEGVPLLERRADPRLVGVVGPALDYYFSGWDGFHFQIAGGVGATISRQIHAAPGAALGLGHEWSTSVDWNVGFSLRLTTLLERDPTFAPGVLLTTTCF